eukprot:TRINITY_DN215_c0_g1_i6.p1 TRINITY_DN215_c0_g1~~TRINITY_DN215_c0_g1_i6.p1  ORF type:complete len:334 (+),score=114.57 TRINITY_DN215_c0_g1_i6:55-1056(+)
MKSLLLLALAGGARALLTEEYVQANAKGLWGSFKAQYSRNYTSADEEAARYAVFRDNMMTAARLQAAEGTAGATFGATKFSDLTAEEFAAYSAGRRGERRQAAVEAVFTAEQRAAAAATASKDWRKDGAVTGVKDQGMCGSCWAFSTVGGIEGGNFVATGRLVSLSEQELTSCDHKDLGCFGGLQERAFDWLVEKKQGQIVTEAAYPYKSKLGLAPWCKDTSAMEVGATVTGYKAIAKGDDAATKAALLAHGPLTISVEAGPWQSYTGGVFTGGCTTQCSLDHGVTLVGFGTSGATSYWVVKNSWAADWGENGFIRVAFGHSGVSDEALIPTI